MRIENAGENVMIGVEGIVKIEVEGIARIEVGEIVRTEVVGESARIEIEDTGAISTGTGRSEVVGAALIVADVIVLHHLLWLSFHPRQSLSGGGEEVSMAEVGVMLKRDGARLVLIVGGGI